MYSYIVNIHNELYFIGNIAPFVVLMVYCNKIHFFLTQNKCLFNYCIRNSVYSMRRLSSGRFAATILDKINANKIVCNVVKIRQIYYDLIVNYCLLRNGTLFMLKNNRIENGRGRRRCGCLFFLSFFWQSKISKNLITIYDYYAHTYGVANDRIRWFRISCSKRFTQLLHARRRRRRCLCVWSYNRLVHINLPNSLKGKQNEHFRGISVCWLPTKCVNGRLRVFFFNITYILSLALMSRQYFVDRRNEEKLLQQRLHACHRIEIS